MYCPRSQALRRRPLLSMGHALPTFTRIVSVPIPKRLRFWQVLHLSRRTTNSGWGSDAAQPAIVSQPEIGLGRPNR
jgi:hypothetical protein